MPPTPEQIVACARSWLGTRFAHQGRLKRTQTHQGGVDCLGLLVGVARELDIHGKDGLPLAQLDETDYAHYPDTVHLRWQLSRAMQEFPVDQIQPGDVVLMSIDGHPQHLGIIAKPYTGMGYTLIHAYAPARKVVEHALDDYWQSKVIAVYRVAIFEPQASQT
jgi:cell wall-associated NlpC family hydrolase